MVNYIDLSEKIEIILYIFEQCQSDIRWYEAKFKDEERRENNIRHEMEGVSTADGRPPKYERRAVLATEWQKTLIARRVAKDNIALNRPFADFLISDAGKDTINRLRQKLGEVRKVEKDLQNRVYYKRNTNEAPDDPVKNQKLNKLIREWKRKNK